MRLIRPLIATTAIFCLASVGCSDDLATPDVGPGGDGNNTTKQDKTIITNDKAVNPPAIPPRAECEADCLLDDNCVTDPTSQKCMECVDDSHCAGHPSGPVCSDGTCTCDTDGDCAFPSASGTMCRTFQALKRCGCDTEAECAGTFTGTVCFTELNYKCTCNGNNDCSHPGLSACQLPYFYADYKQCEPACTSDSDCGKDRLQKCQTDTGLCLECLDDSDCADVDRGHECMADNRCRCDNDDDCPGGLECMEEAFSTTMYCFEPEV